MFEARRKKQGEEKEERENREEDNGILGFRLKDWSNKIEP